MNPELEKLIEESMTPIPGENPCGINARYETDYDEVVTEIQKLTSMSSAEDSINWDRIVANGSNLLKEKTKDINLIGYLSLALLVTRGYPGLRAGLEIYRNVVEKHWDHLYPPAQKAKRRAAALEWLDHRCGDMVDSREATSADAEDVQVSLNAVNRIKEITSSNLGNQVSGLGNLRSALESRQAKVGPARAEPSTEAAPAEGRPQTAPPPPSGPVEAAEYTTAGEVLDAMKKLAATLRGFDPQNPVAYRILRQIKWDSIREEPPTQGEGDRTLVPPPRPAARESIEKLYGSGNWDALLGAAEAAFAEPAGTFWLDVQWYAHAAMQSLGPNYDAAADAVAGEAGSLIQRLPGLLTRTFSDGAPFCGDQTRAWLEELSAAGEEKHSEGAYGNGSEAGDEQEKTKAMAEVEGLIKRNDLTGALAALQKVIDAEPSERARYLRRLDAALFCIKLREPAWARAILEGLVEEADRFTLEGWEPSILRDVYGSLLQCYTKLSEKASPQAVEDLRQRSEHLREKLFRLDLGAAFSFTGKQKKKK